MRSTRNYLIFLFPAILVLLSGCSLSLNSNGTSVNSTIADLGGVFLSTDSGGNFKSQSLTPSVSGKPGNINGVNVKSITIDPSDNTALYMSTYGQGLYYTYNILTGWLEVANLPKLTINALVVNPKNKCDIYVTYANRLARSVDCARTWNQTYLDAKPETIFSSLAIDSYNPKNVYLGTSNGDILKSIDGGYSWRTLKRLEEPIASITLSPKVTRHVYIVTKSARIYSFYTNKATDADNSEDIEANFAVSDWSDLNKVLQDINIGSSFEDLVITPKEEIFLATQQSIVRSPDSGITWQKLSLLPAEKDAIIKTIAVNPQNSNDIYYATNLTFFKSADGGVTWSNKRLPTSRIASDIQVDYKNPNIVYLGAYRE